MTATPAPTATSIEENSILARFATRTHHATRWSFSTGSFALLWPPR